MYGYSKRYISTAQQQGEIAGGESGAWVVERGTRKVEHITTMMYANNKAHIG